MSQLKIKETVLPDKKVDFNTWAKDVKKALEVKSDPCKEEREYYENIYNNMFWSKESFKMLN